MRSQTLVRGNVLSKVFMGLFGSLLAATCGVYVGQFVPPGIPKFLMIVELVMIIAAMFFQRRRNIGYTFVYTFTFISGITLFPVITAYAVALGAPIVIKALAVTAGAFLISSIVASRTSLDFSFLGGFLFIGLMVILLMGVVSLFTGFSTMTNLVYSFLGIAIFIGYVLYDVNRIARNGIAEQQIPWLVLTLYLDFVNLFLFVLRMLGLVQSNRR